VLQRLGSAPLDEDLTPSALEIRDGETLYLRPRDSQLPPTHFDDLIDGLATGVKSRPDQWRDPMTRVLFLVIGVVALGVGFTLLLGAAFPGRAGVAGTVAVVLVLGALMCSRALGDGWAATTVGLAAVPYAVLMGLVVPSGGQALSWDAPGVLSASAAATTTTAVVMVAVGTSRAAFLGMLWAGVAAFLGAMLAAWGFTPAQSVGSVVVLTLMASVFAPTLAFRLARLRLPQLPTGAADLSDDIEPYPGPELLAGAARADAYLTWMFIAVGVICTTCAWLLTRYDDNRAQALAVVVSFILLIRSRGLTSGWQRASVLVPALLGLALFAIHLGDDDADPGHRVLVVAVMVITAAVMLAFSRLLPGRRLLPYWGRIADIVEYVFAIGMMLLLLWVFDVYQWARGLAG
jgi:type VII secretion integral membrane protein EccD